MTTNPYLIINIQIVFFPLFNLPADHLVHGLDVGVHERPHRHHVRPEEAAGLAVGRGVQNRGFGLEVSDLRGGLDEMSALRWGTRVWESNDE